ncbi:MAG: hypothetical protein H5T64_04350 [Chloroflexi bacterium]|nr:hypothetical protein [Chloroflexota bacterium]
MIGQRGLRTQRAEYWQEFAVHDEDLVHLYEWLTSDGQPHTLDELALQVVEQRCRDEEESLAKEVERGRIYQPESEYQVGETLVFTALDYAVGEVIAVRPGDNPAYGDFSVIAVRMKPHGEVREFAANFKPPHALNRAAERQAAGSREVSPSQLYQMYGEVVRGHLVKALRADPEFVHWDHMWFLRSAMPEVTIGHLNIAEAMIDMAGKPLPPQEILAELDFPAGTKPAAQLFALNYALSRDERFTDIGTSDKPLWFLTRMIPQAVLLKPQRLVPVQRAMGGELINRELLEFAAELQDEADELLTLTADMPPVDSYTFPLSYPDRREGTITLTAAAMSLFPTGRNSRLMISFLDVRGKTPIRGWVVPDERYAWGLGEWYESNGLPAGATIQLTRTGDPFTIAVSYEPRSRRGEWVYFAAMSNGNLTFSIQKRAYTCRYDRYLLMEVQDEAMLDAYATQLREKSLSEIVLTLFPELAKLSGQGLVHAKTLYAAVNLVRRCGAIPIFAELTRQACFDPVGGGNWVYDESLKGVLYTSAAEMSERPRSRRQDLIRDQVYPYGMTIVQEAQK